jgi:hypothetical protein
MPKTRAWHCPKCGTNLPPKSHHCPICNAEFDGNYKLVEKLPPSYDMGDADFEGIKD